MTAGQLGTGDDGPLWGPEKSHEKIGPWLGDHWALLRGRGPFGE